MSKKAICTGDSKNRISIHDCILPIGLLGIFLAILFVFGERHNFPDTTTYTIMSPDVSFGYPLFLAFCRIFAKGDGQYFVAALLQNIWAAFAVWRIAEYIARRFRLSQLLRYLIALIYVVPFVATYLFTSSGLVITNSALTEGLMLPGYLVVTKLLFEAILDKRGSALIKAGVLGTIMFVIRPQMIILLLTVLGVAIYWILRNHYRKGFLYVLIGILTVVGVYLGGNNVYRRYFASENKENSLEIMTRFTQVLYASKPDDVVCLEGEDAEIYAAIMEQIVEKKANYQYASGGLRARVQHLEEWHDIIKRSMVYDTMYAYYALRMEQRDESVITSKMVDSIGRMQTKLLKRNFGVWLYDYFACAMIGLIRTNSVDRSVLIYLSVALYLAWLIMTIMINKRQKGHPVVRIGRLMITMVVTNSFCVAMMIMCLSRYMIYNMSTFYVILLLEFLILIKRLNLGEQDG